MEQESFRERNRRRRERNAFQNLFEYARETDVPNPKQAAERAARTLHGDGPADDRSPSTRSRRQNRNDDKDENKVPHRLDDRTKEQLYERAKELDIDGRSQMSKDELIDAIRAHQ